MLAKPLALVCLIGLTMALPAHARVSIGANVGLSSVEYVGEYAALGYVSFGVPANALSLASGLRVGYQPGGGQWAATLDLGLFTQTGGGSDRRHFQWQTGFSYAVLGSRPTSPFIAGRYGLQHVSTLGLSGAKVGTTRPFFGGGLGVRHRVSDGWGMLRGELRYDRLPQRERADGRWRMVWPAANVFGMQVGFDLMLGR